LALNRWYPRSVFLDGNGSQDNPAFPFAYGNLNHPKRQQYRFFDIQS